jgi:nitroimidazol reductase NimA-like FMN-containing flavoprotein (pyridoxamine 5'-phosphate oxidase superfamily)
MNKRRQIQMSAEEQAAFLRGNRKAALATIDQHGFPHVVGMNYFVKDGAFYMTSYGKAQKVLNIRRNPKVSLMVESGQGYSELRGVMIRGHCEVIDDADAVRPPSPTWPRRGTEWPSTGVVQSALARSQDRPEGGHQTHQARRR